MGPYPAESEARATVCCRLNTSFARMDAVPTGRVKMPAMGVLNSVDKSQASASCTHQSTV